MGSTFRLLDSDALNRFLGDNRARYLDLLRSLKALLTGFKFSEEGRDVIHSIYSRGDRQPGGEELKVAWKIKEQVNREREKGKPTFQAADLHDIVGLTVVCIHPSAFRNVETFLRNSQGGGDLRIISGPKEMDEGGYVAEHYVLGRPEPITGSKCELQVKTILHDAWSAWTHDLTYKPQGLLPEDLEKHMEFVGTLLKTIDAQSELFTQQVRRQWEWARARKQACASHLSKLLAERGEVPEGPCGAQYRAVVDELNENEETYREGDVSTVLSQIQQFADECGYGKDACRLVTRLAAIRARDDLDYTALDYIDRWVDSAADAATREQALTFKGLALFAFNLSSEAVEAGEAALSAADEHGNEGRIVLCRMNLAYNLAELGEDRDGSRSHRTLALIEGLDEEALTPSQMDSAGFVWIIFGKTRADVKRGLSLCERAAESSNHKDVATAFLEHHRLMAYQRLTSPTLPD